jgi:group I intron endonuclease
VNRPGLIYLIRNAGTDKVYVGSTVVPRGRKNSHFGLLRRGKHHCIHLQRAFTRHGEDAFSFVAVEAVAESIFLHAREQFWMWRLAGRLYNTGKVAGCPLGVKRSMEFKAAQSARLMGNAIRRGMQMSTEAKAAISVSLGGNTRRVGIPHKAEDCEKISAGLKLAHSEGRRKPTSPTIAAENLRQFNADVASGARVVPWAKPERNAEILAFHLKTRSLKQTAAAFGVATSSAWEIIRKYNPSQLRSWKKQQCS